MKQISLHILAAAVTALTLTACNKDDIGPDSVNVVPIFTATIEGGQSRVNGDNWEPGDEIGITCTAAGATNYCYVTSDGDGRFAAKDPSKKIFYKSSSISTTTWTFNAYYPWSSTTPSSIYTSDQTKQKSFDYLYATAKGSKDSPAVELEFNHMMSKVTFIFKNGKDFNVNDIISYSLGDLYLNGKLNTSATSLWTCSATTTGTANKATSVKVDLEEVVVTGEPVPPLILLPQTVPGTGSNPYPVELKIECRNGESYAATLFFPSNKLEAGNNYKFTVMVSKTGLTVSNCSIENWDDYKWSEGGDGQGSASSADDPDEFNN